jgi:hypothetical protein
MDLFSTFGPSTVSRRQPSRARLARFSPFSPVDARGTPEGDAVMLQHDRAGTGECLSKLGKEIGERRRLPRSTVTLVRIVVPLWLSGSSVHGRSRPARRAEMQLDSSPRLLAADPAIHSEFDSPETRERIAGSANRDLLVLLDLTTYPLEQAAHVIHGKVLGFELVTLLLRSLFQRPRPHPRRCEEEWSTEHTESVQLLHDDLLGPRGPCWIRQFQRPAIDRQS